MTKFINLTPHPVTLFNEVGEHVLTIDPMPTMRTPRVYQRNIRCGEAVTYNIDDDKIIVPLYRSEFGEVTNLPPAQKDTIYIVSRMVRQAVQGREDVVCPGIALRDETGAIIGAKGLSY